ncbi:MAG TPA: M20 family peptidase, partial [Woeseiaceae bacterium]
MRSLLLALLAILVAIAGIVITRTLLHTPASLHEVPLVDVAVDEQRIARHLSEAIRFPTVSHERGADTDEAAFEGFIAWVKDTYPEVNETASLTRLGHTLLYRWEGSNPDLQPILITGHYDVVPVIPGTEGEWREPPFAGKIVDSVIWGRGALDDKSGVIAILEAATVLMRSGFVPERTIYLSFGHDEELGGANGAGAVRKLLAENNVRLAWSLDEGSFVFADMLPGVAPLMATINVAEKGSVTLDIVARADGGHSSMPPRQTAVGILAGAITALERNPLPGGLDGLSFEMFDVVSRHMPFLPRMLFANQWLFGGILESQLSSLAMTNAMLRTTTAPTMLSASVKTNVLPIEAIATVNFRTHPRDSVEDVIEHVREVVESDAVEVRLTAEPATPASPVSDASSEGFTAIQRAIRETYGDVIITPGLMVAASDSRHYGQVADNAFRFNPMIVRSEDLTGFHGTNEKIAVDNLAQGTRTYVQIMKNG